MVIQKVSIFLLIIVVSCVQAQPITVAEETSLKDVALPLVNGKRNLHQNTPNLVWSYAIETDAQSCAMSAASTKTFTNCFRMNHNFGKIMFTLYASNSELTASFVIKFIVDHIYKSGANYVYGSQTANSFSQLIWKSSSELGVGFSNSEGDNGAHNYYIVFYFYTRGNVGDLASFKANVQPPIGATTQIPLTTTTTTTTTTTAAPTPGEELDNFQALCLSEHNARRALHLGTPEMTYDFEIEESAQLWADQLAATEGFQHEDPIQYGENLFRGYTTATTPISDANAVKYAVTNWYNELSNYDYGNPGFSSETGHFTQVIWKASTKLGCGISRYEKADGKKYVIVVARYYSPGNVPGQFTANVLPL